MFSSCALAEQTNPNKLPRCPSQRFTSDNKPAPTQWHNCWGRYKYDLGHSEFGGEFFEGIWINGALNGHGIHERNAGRRFVGELKNGIYHGQGKLTEEDNNVYVGEWKEGKRSGNATYFFKHGKTI